MSTGVMRRAQLVAPFGVGAMSVLVNGTSVITAGLDHWYEPNEAISLALEEYQEHDWRLEARLRVSEFRLPPDFRYQGQGNDNRNVKLTVPVLRFPRWCFCMFCKRLELSTLTMRQAVVCKDKRHADWKFKPRMSQVPFVAVCADGHLDDFPFGKWVHRALQPSCNGTLRLKSLGGGGLEGQRVVCDGCQNERTLRGITEARFVNGEECTNLSDQLSSPEDPYLCTGARPWLAKLEGVCAQPMRGALRAAGNVYFPKVESSIYLPRKEGAVSAEMHELMRHPAVSTTMRTLHSIFGAGLEVSTLRAQLLKNVPPELFRPISDDELIAGYRDLLGVGEDEPESGEESDAELLTGDDEWRYPEFQHIRETPKDDYLTATDPGIHADLDPHLDRVRSVDVLRETRALRGFTRVRDGLLKLSAGKALLRREPLPPVQDWLPAYVVKGEGIYFELDPQRLVAWEARAEVQARAQAITDRYGQVASQRGLQGRLLNPRFVLLHTLGHLLINELVFACGYSSASLRERLYVSTAQGNEMAGLLIYTAAGDSEGTMGGLVRMARPDNLRSVFASAISDARWCSTDPVCMDAGERGQGPDSCNLAACHGCALMPETSCEEFNRFLDRGLVIGTFRDPSLGYFSSFA
ncbi:DrmB family protein [Micromonospora chalcea]|uniref:DrmB family protein n=1 Tax=Micromonospora chalcea TaxID=1874 RepID=UPI00378F7270